MSAKLQPAPISRRPKRDLTSSLTNIRQLVVEVTKSNQPPWELQGETAQQYLQPMIDALSNFVTACEGKGELQYTGEELIRSLYKGVHLVRFLTTEKVNKDLKTLFAQTCLQLDQELKNNGDERGIVGYMANPGSIESD